VLSAPFAAGVNWSVDRVSNYLKDGIVCGDGKQRKLQFLKQDTQSDSNRAAQVAGDLITNENVDIMLSLGSPDTTRPDRGPVRSSRLPQLELRRSLAGLLLHPQATRRRL